MINTNTNTARLTILRGLPGSGKSRFTGGLEAQGAVVASADRFPGLYDGEFNPANLDPAHGLSVRTAIEGLQAGRHVVVDNTNLSVEELVPYVALAQAFRVDCEIVTVNADPETAFGRNTHGVPRAVFFGTEERPGGMVARFEAFEAPFHWQFLPWLSQRTA